MNYIALIHKEEDSDYGVSFPDLPGCISAGETLEQAKLMAEEAIIKHINLLKEMDEPIPAPSTLEEIMSFPENRSAIAFLVQVPSSHSVRINITIFRRSIGSLALIISRIFFSIIGEVSFIDFDLFIESC